MSELINVFGLKGKVTLVTGASRGIGAEIAMLLGQAGATVIGTATSEAGADRISQKLATNNISGTGICLNLTQLEKIDEIMKTIETNFGTVDILINNAGITRDNLFMRMKEEEWDDVLKTNLTGVFKMAKAVVRGMVKKRWGRIINISSVSCFYGNPGQTNYAAAKAGLSGFTRSLAREVGSRGITVNAVAPGFIETDMTKEISETHVKSLLEQIPLQRMGSTKDIASGVLFLASEASGYITGETLHINGGLYMA